MTKKNPRLLFVFNVHSSAYGRRDKSVVLIQYQQHICNSTKNCIELWSDHLS